MPALRRLTAVVTMLVTLLLVLTESGFACAGATMPGMAAASSASAATGMDGMAMPDAPSSARQRDARPDRAPCRFPWAPGGCRDMAPCAPAALTVVALLPTEPAPAPDSVVVERVAAPASVETPPELPPPRA